MNTQPEWMTQLVEHAAQWLLAVDLPAPIGVHYACIVEPESLCEVHEISLFYGETEVLGGELDGRRTQSAFWLKLDAAEKLFDRIDNFYWQSARLGDQDDLGPHVGVEGEFLGNAVRLRILAQAPGRFNPARTADTISGKFIDLW